MNENRYSLREMFWGIFHAPSLSVFKKLKYFLLFILCYSVVVGILDYKLNIAQNNIELGQFHLLFSFCLSIIIAFRINVAYSRWWEARGYWGTLVNNCRNLALKINSYIGIKNDPKLKDYIAKLPLLLKCHLQRESDEAKKVMQNLGVDCNEEHFPNLLMQKIINRISYYRSNNQISFEQFLALDAHVSALTDVVGGCEKIMNTLMPAGFSIFTRVALLFYMLIFPFGWVDRFNLFIIPILAVLIYVLLGLEIMAEEMEEPFGDDYNDLPLSEIAASIDRNIEQIAAMPRD